MAVELITATDTAQYKIQPAWTEMSGPRSIFGMGEDSDAEIEDRHFEVVTEEEETNAESDAETDRDTGAETNPLG